MSAVDFWDEKYASKPQVWSGRANAVLVDIASDLPPGRALELGAGEGGDAIWLAQQGWQVTAMEISTVAIERARAGAESAGVGPDRIEWVAQDLATWKGEGSYDLVTAFFLQSPVELPRAEILRKAAGAVAPGGHLLIVTHAAPPPWATQLHAHHHDFPTPADEVASLNLAAGEWEVVIADVRSRTTSDPDGNPAVLDDTIVLVHRLP